LGIRPAGSATRVSLLKLARLTADDY
jgi:hypothetical protein